MNKLPIHRVTVDSATGSYDVLYGSGLIGNLSALMGRDTAVSGAVAGSLAENTGIFVLSSPRVSRHWQAKIIRGIAARTVRAKVVRATVLFDDREAKKNIATVEQVCRQLVRLG